ncbi:MAG: DUF116 domain-containing protein [Candidatus Methanomethylicota archaeon]|uniref:DUF116 domain-containing protein n=1 Tax=Thermoproteota archaeon TaxID=2056631 RepID=A0A497ESS3_9CREN|nr:MAG: DUF116 domain-containing protein [Candidatus Verstraetearchaeota archaeon]
MENVNDKESMLMKAIKRISKLKFSGLILEKLEQLAVKLGVDERELLRIYVEIKNAAYRVKYALTPYAERILLLPQCLRNPDCPAKLGEFGYECIDCGKCMIGKIVKYAKELGYKGTYIIPGGSVITKIFEKVKPKACLGVACLKELVLGSFLCEKFGVIGQGIPLLKDGCINTTVNWREVFKLLTLKNNPMTLI